MMAVHSTRNGVPPEGYMATGTPEPEPLPAGEPIPVEIPAEPEPEAPPEPEPPEESAEPERAVPRRSHHGKR